MTDQNQPPTPDEPTPDPQPAYTHASAPHTGAAVGSANPLDLATMGAGALAFITSFLPFYTVSATMFGTSVSDSATAWHGFFGWFGVLCALAGAGLVAAQLMKVSLPVPARLAALGAFGLAALCLVIALFVFPGGGCDDLGTGLCKGIDLGRGIGYWLTLLLVLAGLGLSAVRRGAE